MAKTRNTNYRSSSAVDFYFAPTGGEQFARVDLSVVAKALDEHDHNTGLGLAVARIGSNSVGTTAIVDLAVTAAKLAGSIPGSKILANNISDTQLDAPRTLRAGDSMTGSLTVSKTGPAYDDNTLYSIADFIATTTNPEPGGGVHNVAAIGFHRQGVEGAGFYYYNGDFYYRTSAGLVGKLYSTQNFSPPGAFVIGMIIYWNQAASIPTGWAELTAARNRFLIGANGSYTFDATGGATTIDIRHVHDAQHSHTITRNNFQFEDGTNDNNNAAVDHTETGGGNTGENLSTTQSILNPYLAKTCMVYTG